MTMPAEHREAEEQLARERAQQGDVMKATVENSRSMTAVNHSLVKFNEARAELRHTVSNVVPWAVLVGVAWSVWAMVHWA